MLPQTESWLLEGGRASKATELVQFHWQTSHWTRTNGSGRQGDDCKTVPQGCCGQENRHPQSEMYSNPWIWMLNSGVQHHCLWYTFFFPCFPTPRPPPRPPACSSRRKEKGQPVLLCKRYSYGMLLLKEHSCIAVRQTSPPTRAWVCSLWVARLQSLKSPPKPPNLTDKLPAVM